jgi:hypothetical protein
MTPAQGCTCRLGLTNLSRERLYGTPNKGQRRRTCFPPLRFLCSKLEFRLCAGVRHRIHDLVQQVASGAFPPSYC